MGVYLGVYMIPVCDTVQYNNGAQDDTEKIYFIKKIELDS